jgi:hypothetical protein
MLYPPAFTAAFFTSVLTSVEVPVVLVVARGDDSGTGTKLKKCPTSTS